MPDERHRLDEHFLTAVAELPRGEPREGSAPVRAGSALSVDLAWQLFEAQCESRHCDFAAAWLRSRDRDIFGIPSAGHEGNAALAAALRPDDPVLAHYRSGAFYCARARQRPGHDAVNDIVLGMTEPSGDSAGSSARHWAFGNRDLAMLPQTATIASHLPRAVGLAFLLDRARRVGVATPNARDSIVVAGFGDASVNHSTLVGSVNTALSTVYQGLPVPVLLVCEDNGFGISARMPAGWIQQRFSSLPGLRYIAVNGCDTADTFDAASQAAEFVRSARKPAFLHLKTVRYLGHADDDSELEYRTPAELTADYARDPLVDTARLLARAGAADGPELVERYEAIRTRVRAVAASAASQPRLARRSSAPQPAQPDVLAAAAASCDEDARRLVFAAESPEQAGPLTLAESVNRALLDEMARRPNALCFGEDVSVKGGVYGVTRGLRKAFGGARVFDTLLDEQAILGVALGAGLAGFLPIAEIQDLAYLHNAEDQLRAEAATLWACSGGEFANPMLLRIPGLGHRHGAGRLRLDNNSVAVLRDLPGVLIAVPAHPSDAPALVRTLAAAADCEGSVGVLLEPVALYHERDLFTAGDGGWLAPYAGPGQWADEHIPVGRARRWFCGDTDGSDLTIICFGNGVRISLRAAHTLSQQGISARVLDLRWLSPLPVADIVREAAATGQVLVVDETRKSGGVSEAVVTALVDAAFRGGIRRITAADSMAPADAATGDGSLPDEAGVLAAALDLLGR